MLRTGHGEWRPKPKTTAPSSPRQLLHSAPAANEWNQFISVGSGEAEEAGRQDRDDGGAGNQQLPGGHFRLAVKDNMATLGQATTCGSGLLRSYRSPFEATVVGQLRRRGAAVVGKTNMDEFGMGSHSTHSAFGAVRGAPPHSDRHARSAGGSSGGSAVTVRLGQADVALGTDTGGSVRLPAAYNAVAGYKASYGMLSRFGVVPYANSLDTVGLLARHAGPVRRLVVDGGLWREHDALDPTSASAAARRRFARQREGYAPRTGSPETQGLTFGVPREYNIAELDGRILDAWAAAVRRLLFAGASVVPVSLPSTRHALSAYYVIAPAEASSNLAKYDGVRYGNRAGDGGSSDDSPAEGGSKVLYGATRTAGFGAEAQRRILLGTYSLSSEAMHNHFIQAQKVRRLVQRDFDRVFRLANPLRPQPEQFDLSDMADDGPALADKTGPAQVDFLLCPTAPHLCPRPGGRRCQQHGQRRRRVHERRLHRPREPGRPARHQHPRPPDRRRRAVRWPAAHRAVLGRRPPPGRGRGPPGRPLQGPGYAGRLGPPPPGRSSPLILVVGGREVQLVPTSEQGKEARMKMAVRDRRCI